MTSQPHNISNVSMTKGIILLLLGIVAIAWPGFTFGFLLFAVTSFVIALGLTAIVAGIFSIGKGWKWILTICLGVLAVILGVSFFIYPFLSSVTYVWLLGAYLAAAGLLSLVHDPQEVNDPNSRRVQVLDGVLMAILGVMLIFFPLSTTTIFYWIFAWYALIAGIVMIITSMKLKKQLKKMNPATSAPMK